MKLTANFTLPEMIKTNTGLPNEPGATEILNLFYLCTYILQPMRNEFRRIKVNRGYSSIAVNIKIKGSYGSQHLQGAAADIYPLDSSIDTVYNWIANNKDLRFGQAILYKTANRWIHISLPRWGRENQELLVSAKPGKYKPYLMG